MLVELRDTPLQDWTHQQVRAAEVVCHTYDTVGIMVRHEMIPVECIADSWGDSLRRTWAIVVPLVRKYRDQRKSDEYWDDYEWLAAQALRFQKHR